jgi:hypothetical protein
MEFTLESTPLFQYPAENVKNCHHRLHNMVRGRLCDGLEMLYGAAKRIYPYAFVIKKRPFIKSDHPAERLTRPDRAPAQSGREKEFKK